MFDASNTYASKEQVEKRLTAYAKRWALDVDQVDRYTDTLEESYYEEAIDYANNLADEALAPYVDISPRPANEWIKDRVVDIAVARVISLGGRDVEVQLQNAADDAQNRLNMVREGAIKVPGLVYTQTLSNGVQGPAPFAVVNLGRCCR